MRKGRLIIDLEMVKIIFDKTACDEADKIDTVVACSKTFFSVSLNFVEKTTNAYNLLYMYSTGTLRKQSRLLFHGILLTGQIL